MANNKEGFPQYFRNNKILLAFHAKDRMFKIEPVGSNNNPGVTIDYYITRSMVLKHHPGPGAKELHVSEFKELLTTLYGSYIEKICG